MPNKDTRQRILALVAERPGLQAWDIAIALGIHYQWACKHIKSLRDAGYLLRTTVVGKTTPLHLYHIADYPKPTRTDA